MTAGVLEAVRTLRRQQEATGTVSYRHNTWGAKKPKNRFICRIFNKVLFTQEVKCLTKLVYDLVQIVNKKEAKPTQCLYAACASKAEQRSRILSLSNKVREEHF
jgi:hypothetical protein